MRGDPETMTLIPESGETGSELQFLTMFELLASTEECLRIDFDFRASVRRKDPLSRRCHAIRKERGSKIRLDEDILEALKLELESPSAVWNFRGLQHLRDWLAHGRNWHPKLGRG